MMKIDKKGEVAEFPVAIVVSRFNEEITAPLLDGALKRLKELGFSDENLNVAWVPGAIEIPIVAQRFAESGRIDGIVALGAVIRGETDHYDYVCQQVSEGCQHVALQNDIPVSFGLLTCDTVEQAQDRIGGKHGHKGVDAVDAVVETVSVLAAIE